MRRPLASSVARVNAGVDFAAASVNFKTVRFMRTFTEVSFPPRSYPTGDVHLSTTCSTGGRGSPPATFTAWAAVTWDLAGKVVSATTLSNAATVDPTFSATDAYGDIIYNAGAAAYLVVPLPAAPTGVTAVQSEDQFQVSWMPRG